MSKSNVNYGIQGDVKAGAVAVGEGAHAVAIGGQHADTEELEAALRQMRLAIDALQLPTPARNALRADLGQLEDAVRAPAPEKSRIDESLVRLAGRLKQVGVVLGDGVAIVEALKKLGGIIPLSLKAFGLGL